MGTYFGEAVTEQEVKDFLAEIRSVLRLHRERTLRGPTGLQPGARSLVLAKDEVMLELLGHLVEWRLPSLDEIKSNKAAEYLRLKYSVT